MEEEKREFFRAELLNKKAKLHTFNKAIEIIVKNVSARGIAFYVEDWIDPLLLTDAYIEIELDMKREMNVKLINEKKITPIQYFYGMEFTDLTESDENRIVSFLLREQIKLRNIQKLEDEDY